MSDYSFDFGIDNRPLRPMPNIGCGFDIPCGTFITGLHGENILNGGAPPVIVVAAGPNCYKTLLLIFLVGASTTFCANAIFSYIFLSGNRRKS